MQLFRRISLFFVLPYDEVVNFDWETALQEEMEKPYFSELQNFIAEERAHHRVFPPADEVFAAFNLTPLHNTRVLLLGQDPYHGAGQAHGLCFSVQTGTAIPPSLRNIFKELHDDVHVPIPTHGNLTAWANQGVLLLNATLTVREGNAGSHVGHGWEQFTDSVISILNQQSTRCVFVLWGATARKKKALIKRTHHVVIEAPHPSPLSAYQGFFGSRPFSAVNTALRESGQTEIDWSIE